MTATLDDEPADAGLSLAELLVAMTLLGLLTTLLVGTSILGLRTSSDMESRLDDAVQAKLGILTISKVLRTAVLPDQLEEQVCQGCADTAIVSASDTRVVFYANLNNTGDGPSLVTLEVVQDDATPGRGVLREITQPPTPLGGGRYSFCDPRASRTCVVRDRVVARDLVWPTPTVFSYFDFRGDEIPATALSSQQLAAVSSVDVTMVAQGRPGAGGAPATTTVQRVRLPNADVNVLVDPT